MPLVTLSLVATGDTITAARTNSERTNFNLLGGEIEFDSNATGVRFIYIRHSSGLFIASNWAQAISGSAHRISVATMYRLEVNEYVELVGAQSSGITLNMNTQSNDANEFWAGRIGA
jgi:hypothetical protein